MGRFLKNEECVEIRERYANYRGSMDSFFDWARRFGVSSRTISNVVSEKSYHRPECYPPGSPGRAKAERRQREYEADQLLKQKMRYVSAGKRRAVLERDGQRCVYCDADLKDVTAAIDHRVPVSAGGTNEIENLQATCKTCNSRKKDFSGSDGQIRQYLARRRQIDQRTARVNGALAAILSALIWSDSIEAPCPWCCQIAEKIGDTDDHSMHSGGHVWRCEECNRMFCVVNYRGLQEFLSGLNDVIWGRWYGEQEIAAIVCAVGEGDSDRLFDLVAEWAGDVVEVRKRRHSHRAKNGCWCEYGISDYEPVGKPRSQQNRMTK